MPRCDKVLVKHRALPL